MAWASSPESCMGPCSPQRNMGRSRPRMGEWRAPVAGLRDERTQEGEPPVRSARCRRTQSPPETLDGGGGSKTYAHKHAVFSHPSRGDRNELKSEPECGGRLTHPSSWVSERSKSVCAPPSPRAARGDYAQNQGVETRRVGEAPAS